MYVCNTLLTPDTGQRDMLLKMGKLSWWKFDSVKWLYDFRFIIGTDLINICDLQENINSEICYIIK